MDPRVEEFDPMILEINEDTYKGDLHSSIPPAFAYKLRSSRSDDSYGVTGTLADFEPDRMIQEQDFHNNGIVAEDCLMYDSDRDSYILVQGKSHYGNKWKGVNQLANEAPTLRLRDREIYEKLEGLYLVAARPSGVKNPRTDFDKVERGIREEVGMGENARVAADVYEIVPEAWELSPMELLN